ncbi:MAG TPA: hypothetical protein DHV15_13635 [Treponema sp.]|uniref:Uncharacterized protein n=1 Tax=Treponema denticola (strain ATCC 35405 / DSM 14222 / CIP 103919 / JCM 8153 / KCTC 15104) TaxID=243275 RepID=Q73J61_TREDE|nr:hypothetical protein TDE_2715 [Treponema denticola ATCC 35405]HCY96527.1 hypothetical protein [Treponema sp.]
MLIASYGDADGRAAPASAARAVGACGKDQCCGKYDECGCDERRGSLHFVYSKLHRLLLSKLF